jgi:pilus assembly protein CpaC
VKDKKATRAVSGARRRDEGSTKGRAAGRYDKSNAGRLLAWAAIGFACIAAPISWATPGISQERLVSLMPGKRTAIIQIPMGKTQDVRVDGPFTDVTIGDPEVADVTPLTDHSLSILGKKIGTTRVSVYDEGKHPVGLFDVEISYDVSRLAVELNRITGGGIRVSSVNGRLMLSGTALDAVTLDKAVVIARQFAPEVINAVQVLQPQQVVLEVRFVEATREAARELGVQWNSFGKNTLTNIGSRVPAKSAAGDHSRWAVSAADLSTAWLAAGRP